MKCKNCQECKHELEICENCGEVFCKKCGKRWVEKSELCGNWTTYTGDDLYQTITTC